MASAARIDALINAHHVASLQVIQHGLVGDRNKALFNSPAHHPSPRSGCSKSRNLSRKPRQLRFYDRPDKVEVDIEVVVNDAMAQSHGPMPGDLGVSVLELLRQAIGSFTEHRQVRDDGVDRGVMSQEGRMVHPKHGAFDSSDSFENVGDEERGRSTRRRRVLP